MGWALSGASDRYTLGRALGPMKRGHRHESTRGLKLPRRSTKFIFYIFRFVLDLASPPPPHSAPCFDEGGRFVRSAM